MAKRDVGFVDRHAEKAVLGLCAVLLVGAAAFSFGGFRFSLDDRGPTELCNEARSGADRLAQRVRDARPKANNPGEKDPSKDPAAQLRAWFGPAPKGLIQIAGVRPRLPRTQTFPPLVSSISGVSPEDRHGLARIVAPSVPLVTTGRTTFDVPEKAALEDVAAGGRTTRETTRSRRSWVSVAAQVDLIEQDVNFISEKYPPGSYLTVVRVHLQRKDETETWRDWENVDSYLPFEPFERPEVGEPLEEFRLLLDQAGEYVARTKLPDRNSGDRIVLPPVPYLDEPPKLRDPDDSPAKLRLEANRRSRRWRELAQKAMKGKTASKAVDLDAAVMLVRAAMASGADATERRKVEALRDTLLKAPQLTKKQRRKLMEAAHVPERLMPIVAHDWDVIPGHAYRYRMRYEVLNQYAGIAGELNDPADAERLTVLSDWSDPSRPVEVESDVHFFLTSADRNRDEVTVAVYKKTRAGWKTKEFKVKAGGEIGRNDKRVQRVDFSTGAICVDIDFSRVTNKKKTVAMVYLDRGSGLMRERLLSTDKKDKLRRKLDGLRNGRG